MAEEYLSYSDLLKPDNALTEAIASLERLGEVYTALTNQIKGLAAETKTAIKGIDKRTKAGRAEAEGLAAEINEIYEAYLKLAKQQTEVGKTLEFIKNQMSLNSKAYKEEFTLANTIAGSYENLELRIKELKTYWKSLSPELAKSKFGQKVKAQIDALEVSLDELKGIISPVVTEQDKLIIATAKYEEKLNALKNVGDIWAKAKHDLEEYTRALTLQYEQQDKLIRAREELKWMQDPNGGQEYVRIQQEIQKIKDSLKPVVTEMDKLNEATSKYQEKLAAMQQVGDVYMQSKLDLENYTRQLKENIDFQNKLAEAKRRVAEIQNAGVLTDTTTGTTTSTYIQEKAELEALNKVQKDYLNLKAKELQADQYEDNSFAQKKARLDALIQKLKLMGDAGVNATNVRSEISNLQKEIADFEKSLKPVVTEQDKLNEATSRYLEKYAALQQSGSAWVQAKQAVDSLTASLTRQYKQQEKLTEARAERDWLQTVEGQDYLRVQQEITAIKDAMKPAVDWQEKLTKATQEYVDKHNAMLAVGDAYLQAKHNLDAYTRSMQEQLELQTKLTEARQRFADIQAGKVYTDNVIGITDAYSKEKGELEALNRVNEDYIRLKRLEQQEAMYETGSYRQRSIAYQKLTLQIKLMATDTAELRKKKLELQTQAKELYFALRQEEEAMGNYHRSVGRYNIVWDGLKNQVNQLVRELPSLAVSMNTFFLAISNNLPMLIDEINKAKAKNIELAKAGEDTIPVYKQIGKAIFSWQTALVLVLTILPKYGEQIWEGTKEIIRGRRETIKTTEVLSNLSEELGKNSKEYGKNIVNLKKLSFEWKNLTSDKEKLQWIKDNKTEFDKLDVSVRNVGEAENIFNKNTELIIQAFKLRAKAAAATKLAMDAYGKSLSAELESDRYKSMREGKEEGLGFFGDAWAGITNLPAILSSWDSFKRSFTDLYGVIAEYAEGTSDIAEKEAEKTLEKIREFQEEANKLFSQAGAEEAHKTDRGRTPKDPTDSINSMHLKVQKKYEESITNLERDELAKRRKAQEDAANAAIRELENIYNKNVRILEGTDKRYTTITEEQKAKVREAQEWITEAIENIKDAWADTDFSIQLDFDKRDYELWSKDIENVLKTLKEGSAEAHELQKALLFYRYNIESIENDKKAESERIDPDKLEAAYNAEVENLERSHQIEMLNIEKAAWEQRLATLTENTEEALEIQLKALEAERRIALLQNEERDPSVRMHPGVIDADFAGRRGQLIASYKSEVLNQQQALAKAELEAVDATEIEITRLTLQHERERLALQLQLAKDGMIKLTKEQIATYEAQIQGIDVQLGKLNLMGRIGEKGLGGALLEKLGFNNKAIKAMTDWTNTIIDNIKSIVDAEVEAAEKAVSLYEERVSAAQSAYDAEIEARNNGYANNVATAKKELQQEKKQLAQKQKLLEQAQHRQEAIDTITQASSLITASANIWSSFSKLGVAGPFLATAAIAAMFGSFAAAKIKARQVSQQSQEYGEGGLEFLEGGSHASGNDIDLQTKNSKGKNMRAEGGEALAIVNKRNTRKYKKMLPGIIDSLNKGTFEDKYLNAFSAGENLALSVSQGLNIDLSKLENDVNHIRKQREMQYYNMPDGTVVVQRKNVRRVIHK